MNLDDLLNEMSEKIRKRDLSDDYLREHNLSTREEIGIGEYAYGITMIPCEWVYEYLSDYKRVLKKHEELKKFHIQDNKHLDFIMQHSIPVQKVKDKIEELKQEKKKYGNCLIEMYEDELVNRDIKILQELLESEE